MRPDAAVAAAPLAGGCVPLCAELMTRSFRWWARNSRARPCSDRALRAVCERAAAAASAAWRAAEGGAAAAVAAGAGLPAAAVDAAAADAVGGVGGQTWGRFAPPEAATSLALAALECAVKLTLGGSAGSFHGLCAPVVQAVDDAVHLRTCHVTSANEPGPLQLLMALPVPPLGKLLEDDGTLSPQPERDLAAALAAGYVHALERTIRSEARLAVTSAGGLSQVVDCVGSLLQNWQGLASLMAYGEPGHVAALLATFGKVSVLAFHGSPGCPLLLKRLHVTLTEAVHPVNRWDGTGSGPADQFWWRRHTDVLAKLAAPRPRGSGAGGCDGDGGGGHGGGDRSGGCGASGAGVCDGGGGGGSGAGGSPVGSAGSGGSLVLQLPPLHQLSLLAGFVAYRWLPLQAREVMREGVQTASVGVIVWLPPLVHAYLQCSGNSSSGSGSAVAVADGGAAAAGASTVGDGQAGWGCVDAADGASGCDGGGVRGGDDSALRWEAASWRWLLLWQLQAPELLAAAAQEFYKRKGVEVLPKLVTALLHLLVAFPYEGLEVLRTRIRAGAQKVPLLHWVQHRLAGSGGVSETLRHLLELAPAVEAGREPSPEDVARLQSNAEFGWAARLGALLPPPWFVAKALPLSPRCAFPACVNLEGDSEAGLRLTVPCEGCYGILSYCSDACRRAHWAAGHKVECIINRLPSTAKQAA